MLNMEMFNIPLRRLRKMQNQPEIQGALESLFGRTLEEKMICLKLGITERPRCSHCGEPILSFPHGTRGFSKFCSKSCSSQATAASNLEKRSTTMLQRYGSTTTLGSEVLRAKVLETTVLRHGGVPGSASSIRAKIRRTNEQRYGGPAPASSSAVAAKGARKKISTSVLKHQKAIEALGFSFDTPFSSIHDTVEVRHSCGAVHSFCLGVIQRYPICPSCQTVPGASVAEREIGDFIDGLGYKTIRRAKIGNPKFEIDVLVPELNLGIEYHGLYWHSTKLGTDPRKHQVRREQAEAEGIRLIQIFEDEFLLKREILFSMLTQRLQKVASRIHARACTVQEVSPAVANKFFDQTHIAGHARCTKAVGLYFKDELVACASIARSRYSKTTSFELIRFSTKLNTSIPGAVSRLVKHLPRPLITYCDLRFGVGNGYLAAGFKHHGDTKPGYWYFKNATSGRVHRSMLQKRKLVALLNKTSNLQTERELAEEAGYNAIYDAGHRRFTLG